MYSAHSPDVCNACNEEGETITHILRCKSPAREALRQQWLQELEEYMESHYTPKIVTQVIIHGVKGWFEDCQVPVDPEILDSASPQLKKAIKEQGKIGWDHFIKGRISREWASFINHALKETDQATKYYTSETWGTDIISLSWKFVLAIWQQRNLDTHGTTSKEKSDKSKERLMNEALWIQEQNRNIQGEDRDYILTTPELLENMLPSNLQAWLRNVKILIKACDRESYDRIRVMDPRQFLNQPRRRDAESGLHTPTCSVRTRS
jgi:hypothetical protein